MNETIKIFQDRMDETKDSCAKLGRGMRGAEQLRWMFAVNGDGEGEQKPGKFDFQGLHDQFDREEAATNYFEAIEEAGAAADEDGKTKRTRQELAMAKFQSDFLSGMERDFHLRRRSRLRLLAHEATSRRHAGSSKGVIQANLLEYLQTQKQRIEGIKGNSNGNGSQ